LWKQTAGIVIAVQHGTLRQKNNFLSYTKLSNSETIVLSNKNVLMQAYGQGVIYVLAFHNAVWHDAKLKDVLYVPDASVHPFSVKATAQNGYSSTSNEKEIVIRRGDGTIATSLKLINDLYLLAIRVHIPRHVAEVHLATKAGTLQVWHEYLGYQYNRHVMKVLKQYGICVEAKKNVTPVLWEKRIVFRNSDKSTKRSWRSD
jgi:hypothetical protein